VKRGHRTTGLAAAGLALTGLLTGCGSVSLYGAPLPGGASLGSDPTEITVQLRDALDLVPQASVKVNNVSVGEVRSVSLDPGSWAADVHVAFNNSVRLPANAVAELKQTTLLGEKYVDIHAPTDVPAQGSLANGATIPVARTNRFPEAEEIFGALSMLLNGGGVGQLRNISHELNKALAGHESDARALLDDVNLLTTTLDAQRGNITDTLDGVNRLSATLVRQRSNLDKVLTDLQPGLKVLEQQRPQLVDLLRSLDRLSDTARHVVHRSHRDLIDDLRLLQPTLHELNRTGNALPNSLQILASPPFTDSAAGAVRGDHMNLNMTLDLDLQALLTNLSGGLLANPSAATKALPPVVGKALPPLPGLLGTPQPQSDRSGEGGSLGGLLPGLGGN
jgi:phospholipid/cholesterol/gamma-HCH transport system substrate-binding protein